MRLSNKQQFYYESQDARPMFGYRNPLTGFYNFGYADIGKSCVTMTTSLRVLHRQHRIFFTKEEVKLDMKSVGTDTGYIIKIVG
jgi:hypothetical protein